MQSTRVVPCLPQLHCTMRCAGYQVLCCHQQRVVVSLLVCCMPAWSSNSSLLVLFNLLQIVKELTLEEKKMFLKFFTGSDR